MKTTTGLIMKEIDFDLVAIRAEVRRRQKESLEKGVSYVVADIKTKAIVRHTPHGVEIVREKFNLFATHSSSDFAGGQKADLIDEDNARIAPTSKPIKQIQTQH
jgi:hypothetical protein